MVGPQHVLRIPGFLMIALALIGSVVVENPFGGGEPIRQEGQLFDVEWLGGMGTVPAQTGNAADGETATVAIQISQLNMTNASFTLTWTDNALSARLSPAIVSMIVKDTNGTQIGENSGSSGGDGIVIAALGLNPVPDNASQVEGSSAEDASDALAHQCPAGAEGAGQWTVELSVTRPAPRPFSPLGNIDWVLSVGYQYYYAKLTPADGGAGEV